MRCILLPLMSSFGKRRSRLYNALTLLAVEAVAPTAGLEKKLCPLGFWRSVMLLPVEFVFVRLWSEISSRRLLSGGYFR